MVPWSRMAPTPVKARPLCCSSPIIHRWRSVHLLKIDKSNRLASSRTCSQSQNEVHPGLPQGDWDYKYHWQPCSSPCPLGDMECFKVEALVQNVLNYPRLPPRIQRCLYLLKSSLQDKTDVVEKLAETFSAELTLYLIKKEPSIIDHDFETLIGRVEALCRLLSLQERELLAYLRKCPHLLVLDSCLVQSRYNALQSMVRFTPEEIHKLIDKYPPILRRKTDNIRTWLFRLRELSSVRDSWQTELEYFTPSMLAFFLRDPEDHLCRLEFLATTGHMAAISLRHAMKLSKQQFMRRVPEFNLWMKEVKKKKEQQAQAPVSRDRGARGASRHQSPGGKSSPPRGLQGSSFNGRKSAGTGPGQGHALGSPLHNLRRPKLDGPFSALS